MIKSLIARSLVLFGVIEIGNFFAHHGANVPVNDYNSHAFVGLIMIICGVFLLKAQLPFDSWTKFK